MPSSLPRQGKQSGVPEAPANDAPIESQDQAVAKSPESVESALPPAPRLPRVPLKPDERGHTLVNTKKANALVLDLTYDEAVQYSKEKFNVVIKPIDLSILLKHPRYAHPDGTLKGDAHFLLYTDCLRAIAMLEQVSDRLKRTRFIGAAKKLVLATFDDVAVPIDILARVAAMPRASGEPAGNVSIDLLDPPVKMKVNVGPDLNLGDRHFLNSGLTLEDKRKGLSYRILTDIQGTYHQSALVRMSEVGCDRPPQPVDRPVRLLSTDDSPPRLPKEEFKQIARLLHAGSECPAHADRRASS
eukprot:tig00000203_g17141.t1